MKWLRSIGLAMTGAAAGLLFYSGSFFVKSYLENQQARDKYEEIQETYTAFEEEEKDPENTEDPDTPEKGSCSSKEKNRTCFIRPACVAGSEKGDRGILWNPLERTSSG